MNIKYKIPCIIFCLLVLLFCSQQNSFGIQYISNDKIEDVSTQINKYIGKQKVDVVGLKSFIEDKNSADRRLVYELIYKDLLNSIDTTKITNCIYFFIDCGLVDKESGNVYQVIQYLNNFSPSFYSIQSQNRLSAIIINGCYHLKKVVLLSGQLNINDLMSYYYACIGDKDKFSESVIWAMHLALSRMGDLDQVQYCLAKVKNIGMNDNVVYSLVPDLLYIQNRLVFDYLLEQMLSKDKNCTTTDPDNEVSIPCAYRLMELVAPYIEDFPVKLYESGDIITNDYTMTLEEVRSWIQDNNYMYKIRD